MVDSLWGSNSGTGKHCERRESNIGSNSVVMAVLEDMRRVYFMRSVIVLLYSCILADLDWECPSV